jgi:hypothetical protein
VKNCHHPARSQSALQTSGAERDGNEYFFCSAHRNRLFISSISLLHCTVLLSSHRFSPQTQMTFAIAVDPVAFHILPPFITVLFQVPLVRVRLVSVSKVPTCRSNLQNSNRLGMESPNQSSHERSSPSLWNSTSVATKTRLTIAHLNCLVSCTG